MKILSTLFLSVLLLCAAPSQAADDWNGLHAWVGRYPSEHVAGPLPLLAQPALKAALGKLLPKAERQTLARLDVETPVRQSGDTLIIHLCRPRNCPTDLAMIVVLPSQKKVWAGFFTREAGRISTRWYGNQDDYMSLPEELRKEFATRHGN
ncbi:hypothetical protein GCM10027046_14650 [Uliginosibacterium flavum]|uniref:Inhibitor of vertebrate lysozyme (Ivy) n=1 Tax=Uliginosibacterium flavum TaxID=1396831 RepID=A0ABV2TN71_9RHOO